ncbi:hypothetical protein AFGD_006132 [Aspergillus flavus]|nr:hypothetical protein AFGD_006132 [Aspergillus flavus]
MRHVGKHLANGESVDQTVEDIQLREWAIVNGILVPDNGGWRLENIIRRKGPKRADNHEDLRKLGEKGTAICSQTHAVLPPASFSEISSRNSLRREEYRIGWISALKVEFRAALQMLDQRHQPILGHSSDDNIYVQGRIGIHNVVLTCLPDGRYGTNFAAMVATRMINTYPNIQIGFMVGIGDGLPSPQNDIRLGDVIVSRPKRDHGGVV